MATPTLVHNEQIKLIANALNSVAVGLIIIGFLAPIAKIMLEGSFSVPWAPLFAWYCAGVAIHLMGLWVLFDLRET